RVTSGRTRRVAPISALVDRVAPCGPRADVGVCHPTHPGWKERWIPMQRTSFVCESIVRARRSVISEFPLAMALLALAFAAASCTTASQDAANDATKSTPQGESQRATSGAATSDASASRRDRLLITAADLASAIASDGLRVLDVRPAEDFSAGHIPGAQRIDIEAWKEAIRGGRHADEEHWAKTIGELGITRDTRVVVYGSEPTSTA